MVFVVKHQHPTSHWLVEPVAPLPMQLPANEPGKAAEARPSAWVLHTRGRSGRSPWLQPDPALSTTAISSLDHTLSLSLPIK